MRYCELDTAIQRSFKLSVKQSIESLLVATSYANVKEKKSVVTDEFVQLVIEELLRKKKHQKWAQVKLDFIHEEIKMVTQEVESKMRKRKPTEKQTLYYKQLISLLELEEKLPKDYFLFKKRLQELIDLSRTDERARAKETASLQRLWKSAFNKELPRK